MVGRSQSTQLKFSYFSRMTAWEDEETTLTPPSASVKNDPKVNCEGHATFKGGKLSWNVCGEWKGLDLHPATGKTGRRSPSRGNGVEVWA